MLAQRPARPEEGRAQGGDDLPVIHLMVEGTVERGGDAARQMRLALARLVARQPLHRKLVPPHVVLLEAELLEVVAIERHHHRPLAAVAHPHPGRGLEVAGEVRPLRPALEQQRQERLLAGLGLDVCGEHAGRRPGGAVSGLAALEHGDGASGAGQVPADGQPADAAADDDDHGSRSPARRPYPHGRVARLNASTGASTGMSPRERTCRAATEGQEERRRSVRGSLRWHHPDQVRWV